ncbi:hypothetical protein [Neobacillus massiliamazoniensis]|uniref:DUF4293 family protein n=1 Tax=Neobacillus massiliamazoniensis TaxID=1499688 RepID=A0A0U1P2R0_9BACI|nr:hypothetical protein [Neobacillus massiliamazoniensis]CRK84521.1 hypothetical protein BN000_04553 [Neobacillus massiliamazoniensis]
MKTAVFMGIIFYSLTILIHFLIISKSIPFTWVNGGRSESFAEQLPISVINIVISIIGVVFTLIVGRIKLYKYKRGITVICWFIVVLWSFGFIQQLFGTPFEKMVCSLVLLLGVISNLRMAIEKNSCNYLINKFVNNYT